MSDKGSPKKRFLPGLKELGTMCPGPNFPEGKVEKHPGSSFFYTGPSSFPFPKFVKWEKPKEISAGKIK